jgi:hypothetical protein
MQHVTFRQLALDSLKSFKLLANWKLFVWGLLSFPVKLALWKARIYLIKLVASPLFFMALNKAKTLI